MIGHESGKSIETGLTSAVKILIFADWRPAATPLESPHPLRLRLISKDGF